MWISHIPLKTTIDLSDQSESDSGLYYEDLVERVQEEVDIFSAQRIESELGQLLESLETKSHLENYNIICLFNVEFSYMKQLFKKLPMDQMCMIKNKWSEAEEFISKKEIKECWNGCSLKKRVDNNHQIIKENGNEDTFYVDLNALIASFTK
ncbi:14074_t:CDS:2 [Entrophospora sp. SA101]|nr:14074_t:CDS:2 [Entrophospora sp. SA101]